MRGSGRDGALVVVRSDNQVFAPAGGVAPTLQAALDDWEALAPRLRRVSAALDAGEMAREPLDPSRAGARRCRAPTSGSTARPTSITSSWCARRAAPRCRRRLRPIRWCTRAARTCFSARPTTSRSATRPGASTSRPRSRSSSATCRMGTRGRSGAPCVRLVLLVNDVTLRNLIPAELAKGFGFFQSQAGHRVLAARASRPTSWAGAGATGACTCRCAPRYNGELVGDPNAGPEMHFSFFELIAHVARTRAPRRRAPILGGGHRRQRRSRRAASPASPSGARARPSTAASR